MSRLQAVRENLRDASVPIGKTLGLNKVSAFADTILLSFFFFLFVHLVLAPVLSSILFPVTFGKAKRKSRNNWSIHVVSQVHCLIVVPLAVQCLGIPNLDKDRAFGWHDQSGFVQAIACGYFMWDCFESIVHFSDVGFVLHAFSCLAIYTLAFQPFLAYYGSRFLLWELSTFFLNIHWFLDKTGRTGGNFQLINGLFLLVTFFGVRIVYGGKMSYDFFHTLYDVRNQIPTSYVVVYGLGNILLQGLNWFWFTKMIAALQKRFSSPGKIPVSHKANGDVHRINGTAHQANGNGTTHKANGKAQ